MNGKESMGFVETTGLVAAIEAADAMVKAAFVSLTASHKIGSAFVCVAVRGDLASCQAAVAAGRAAAERQGGFVQCNVIARPDGDTETLSTEHMPAMRARKASRKAFGMNKQGKGLGERAEQIEEPVGRAENGSVVKKDSRRSGKRDGREGKKNRPERKMKKNSEARRPKPGPLEKKDKE